MSNVELQSGTSAMRQEAGEGGEAVARFLARNGPALDALSQRLRASPPTLVITCARGSSDHAATYGKYLIETLLGLPVASAAPSVTSVFSTEFQQTSALLIAISQSGRSPDLLSTVERYKAAGAYIVALINDEDSPLATMADCLLPLCAGTETSVAATKSFIASLAGLAAIAAWWRDDARLRDALARLPTMLDMAYELDWTPLVDALADARNLFIIGRGYGLSIAQEAALKLKETCGLHAEGFSSAEVRHGPMAIIDQAFPVIAFATSDKSGDDVLAAAAQFADRGANVLLADCRAGADSPLPTLATHALLEPILLIQSFYAAAERLARARGFDPDQPPYLRKVTETR
ncbi:Glucosamine-6-phosphate deaminase [isomerizing],alternative [Sphingobium indicum BiD32]|uniref:Glucosamine-6-phosphate deaminase [isomerizing],alternative n=1 Tax=Sphingobium indicum BiD32 TaxID=1301087 RepID=N1MVB5_9SPHN|nr:SIS domain-containing protein [Sphingobium indicum]CCW19253.1 Glucosamine-6-phosphate deaminase [isomerizing],alternative [Sphingobium indicum BiD32]